MPGWDGRRNCAVALGFHVGEGARANSDIGFTLRPGVLVPVMRVALLWITVFLWLGCDRAKQAVEDTLTAQLQRALARQLGGHVRIARADFDERSSQIVAFDLEFEAESGELRGNAEELRISLSPSRLDRLSQAAIELRRGELWIRSTPLKGGIALQPAVPPSATTLRDVRLHWSTPTGSIDATAVSAELARGDGAPLSLTATLEAVSWAAGRVDATHKLQPQVLASVVDLTASSSQAQPLRVRADIEGLSVPRSASHPLSFQEGRGHLVLASAEADGGVAEGLRGDIDLELAYLSMYAASEGQPVDEVLPFLLADRLALRGAFGWVGGRIELADGFALRLPAPLHLGSLSLAHAQAELAGWASVDGAAELELSELQLAAPSLEVDDGHLSLAFAGWSGAPAPEVQGELQVSGVQLAAFVPRMATYGLRLTRAEDTATGVITVSTRDPGAAPLARLPWRVRTDLKLPALTLASLPFERGTLTLRHAAHSAHQWTTRAERLTLRRGNGTLTLSGLDGGSAAVALHAIPLSGHFGLRGVAVSGTGSLGERNDVRLHLKRSQGTGPELDAELWLGEGAPPALSGCEPSAQAQGRLRLCGTALSGQLLADLWLSGAQSRGLAGSLRLQGLDVLRWFGSEDELAGALALDGVLSLSPTSQLNPGTWSGQLDVRAAAVERGDSPWGLSPAAWSVHRGRVEVSALHVQGSLGRAELVGFFDIARGDYELRGRGTLDAEQFAKRYTDLRSARGVIDLDLAVNNEDGPELRLSPRRVTAHVGSFGLPDLYLREVLGTMRWDGDDFSYEDLHAQVGGGEIRLSGRSHTLDGAAPMELSIAAEGVSLEPLHGMRLSVSAQATLSSRSRKQVPTLAGKVQVHQLHYNRRLPLQQLLRLDDLGSPAAAPRLAFDLLLQDRGVWQIRNSVLDLELASPNGIQVSGTDREPGLSGELVAEHGRVRVHGDELQLELGLIRFTDPTRIAPAFEVRASAAARHRPDGRILLNIAGDSDRAEVVLRCQASGAVPKAFRCDYRDDELTCAGLPELARLWACEP